MTNLLNKTIEGLFAGELNTIQKDVLTWLAGTEAETLGDAIRLLQNVSCESGDVGHLIYNVDCGAYVYDNEKAVLEVINDLTTSEINDVDYISWESHNELSHEISDWESGDDRMIRFEEEHREEASEIAQDDNEDWDSLDEDEQDDAISDALDVIFYQEDPLELTNNDKVTLAWLAFEQHAWNLSEELEGIREVVEGE